MYCSEFQNETIFSQKLNTVRRNYKLIFVKLISNEPEIFICSLSDSITIIKDSISSELWSVLSLVLIK